MARILETAYIYFDSSIFLTSAIFHSSFFSDFELLQNSAFITSASTSSLFILIIASKELFISISPDFNIKPPLMFLVSSESLIFPSIPFCESFLFMFQ